MAAAAASASGERSSGGGAAAEKEEEATTAAGRRRRHPDLIGRPHIPAAMESSPVSTPENEGYQYGDHWFPSVSPSAGTPVVELVMPTPRSPTTAKRKRVSATNASRTDQRKRARCVVGSPATRLINQMALRSSPTVLMSPNGATAQNSNASRTKDKSRQLKSIYWKEFEPIFENGEIIHAKCIHCHSHLSGKQNIGTSHLKKHLERCKARSRVNVMVDRLNAGATSADRDILEDWVYDYELTRRALVRMIVLHELPFSIVDYDGFRDFVHCLNPIFKMVSRTTIKLDCMRAFEDAKMLLKEVFKNSTSKVSLTADMWTSNQTLGYLCVTSHLITSEWKIQKRVIKFLMMESPHNAQSMFNVILKCIQEWNIEDKLFSITLDNAQVNTSMVGMLSSNLLLKKILPCEGNLLHVRCAAHVINLVVQDGLKHFSGIVDNIRESVKYVKSSQSRKEKFDARVCLSI